MPHSYRDDLRKTYDNHAQERDSNEMEEWKFKERADFLDLLDRDHKKKILEIGAGPGRDGRYFQDQRYDVTCIDLSPAMVELCRQKGLKAFVMDMASMEFPKNSFDAVYGMNSLLHLPKEEFPIVLQSIDSLLRPEGIVFIGIYGGYDHEGVWDNDSYIPKRFFSFFSDEDLEQEASKVFKSLTFRRISL